MTAFKWCRSVGGYAWGNNDGRSVLEQMPSGFRPGVCFTQYRKKLQVIVPKTPNRENSPLVYEWRTFVPQDVTPPLFRQFIDLISPGVQLPGQTEGVAGGPPLLSPVHDAERVLPREKVLEFASQYGHLTLHCGLSHDPPPAERAEWGDWWKMIGPVAVLCSDFWSRMWREGCGVSDGAEGYRPTLDYDHQSLGLGETHELWARNALWMKEFATRYDAQPEGAARSECARQLERHIRAELDGRVQVGFEWSDGGQVRDQSGYLTLRPRDLLGFIWIQFARHVCRAEEYVLCPQCGEYFSRQRYGLTTKQKVSRTRLRKPYSHSTYCSALCRKEHHYRTVTVPGRRQERSERQKHPTPSSRTTNRGAATSRGPRSNPEDLK